MRHRPRHLKKTSGLYRPRHRASGGNTRAPRTDKPPRRTVQQALYESLLRKNITNMCVSALIVLLGASSFVYGLSLEPSVTIFRFLTVDGTLFTSTGALVCMVVNLVEIMRRRDIRSKFTYFVRLAMAVAESVIFIVVVFSQLPVFSQHLPMFDRYDSFVMHVLIPIFGVGSFLFNDSPQGKLTFSQRWQGTWFVTFYAVVILSLISSEKLPSELIPYFFLDYRNEGWGIFAFAFVFVYGVAYLMAWGLSEWNRSFNRRQIHDLVRSLRGGKEGP